MLNKDICIRCCNETPDDHIGKWDESDEDLWEDGEVMCRGVVTPKSKECVGTVKDKPPKWCKYALEHVVSPESVFTEIGYDDSDKDRAVKNKTCCFYCKNRRDGITANTCLAGGSSIVVEDYAICRLFKEL